MCRGWTLNTQLRIQPRKGRRAEREKRRAEVEEGRGKGRAVQGIGPL